MARPAWVDPELYPFEDHELDVRGGRVHYVDEGTGPPLLMLHGNPTWSFLYRDMIRWLRDRFRCIAPDYPGFGLSSAAPGYRFTPAEHAGAIEELVLALDLRGAGLLVQDWGGPIGFAVAGRRPERFARFVIGNTWAWPIGGNRGAWAFSRFMGGPIGRRLILNRNVFVEQILPGGVRRSKLSPAVMAHYRGPFPTRASRIPLAVFPREILTSAPFLADVEARLPRLADRPALIVWPERDPAFGERERRRWEELFPDHRTLELAGAGHYFQEDAGEEVVAAIRAWWGDTGSPVSDGADARTDTDAALLSGPRQAREATVPRAEAASADHPPGVQPAAPPEPTAVETDKPAARRRAAHES